VSALAGGRGRRMGGSKPLAELGGAPLIERPRLASGPEAAVEVNRRLEPFPARYEPAWLPELRAALEREAPMRETLAALGPATMTWESAAVRSVDTPEQLAAANET
jgi:molybdopterin-guanine dinucleotide biosynthesis protein A